MGMCSGGAKGAGCVVNPGQPGGGAKTIEAMNFAARAEAKSANRVLIGAQKFALYRFGRRFPLSPR